MHTKYLVIGVNAAGFYAIEALRKHDPKESIIAVNGEIYPPYKRTKVNKNFYPDKLDIEKFQLADQSWYKNNQITLINNTKVILVNISNKTVKLDNGKTVKWDKLLFSTGAESFCPVSDVFAKAVSIRSYSDALRVQELIKRSESVLVYGLGIEAVETAAQLNEAGLTVSIAGRGGKLLKRYFSSHIAGIMEDLFKKKGIDILHNIKVNQIDSVPTENTLNGGKQICIVLEDNQNIFFDFLLYSTGIKPGKKLADACGINTERGIIINSRMETSIPDIYAAGDCAQLESGAITDHWHSAQDQGRTAAANMAGRQQVGCSPMHPKAGLSSSWPVKKYRIKVELFGKFYFSMRPFIEDIPKTLDVAESILSDGAYRLFYYENDCLKGLEMAGDKPRAKLYEQAVNEGWSRSQVSELLG